MSMDDAALVVLNALSENVAQGTSSLVQGTGMELPLGFDGYVAPPHPGPMHPGPMHPGPMHPGMELENVQMTASPAPVHAARPDSGVSPGDILESLSGRIMDESA